MTKSNNLLAHKSKLLFVSLIFAFFFTKTNANVPITNFTQKNIKTIKNSLLFTDNPLVLNLESVDSRKLLRVSFNGNEGIDGELKIYDDQNTLVSTSNFELIKSPFYATVDVTSLKSGSYSVILYTKSGSHNTTLQIK
jgi:hypothetical protein